MLSALPAPVVILYLGGAPWLSCVFPELLLAKAPRTLPPAAQAGMASLLGSLVG